MSDDVGSYRGSAQRVCRRASSSNANDMVIGAGGAGLVAAMLLKEQGCEVQILTASSFPGLSSIFSRMKIYTLLTLPNTI